MRASDVERTGEVRVGRKTLLGHATKPGALCSALRVSCPKAGKPPRPCDRARTPHMHSCTARCKAAPFTIAEASVTAPLPAPRATQRTPNEEGRCSLRFSEPLFPASVILRCEGYAPGRAKSPFKGVAELLACLWLHWAVHDPPRSFCNLRTASDVMMLSQTIKDSVRQYRHDELQVCQVAQTKMTRIFQSHKCGIHFKQESM